MKGSCIETKDWYHYDMNRLFQRTIEDFSCEKCGHETRGTGYTNHCSRCLWSKHVDINPGDRAATCGGLMEPVGLAMRHGTYVLSHRCVICGFERENKVSPDDNFEAIVAVSKRVSKFD